MESQHPLLKPLPSNDSEDVIVDTTVCVCQTEYYEVQSRALSTSPINPVIDPKPVVTSIHLRLLYLYFA